MAGERMAGICCGNMLPMERHVVKEVSPWSLPVLYTPLLSFLEGHQVLIWETPGVLGPQG